jgi:hypothetical protein
MNQNISDRVDCIWLPQNKNEKTIFILNIPTFYIRGDNTDFFKELGRPGEWIDLNQQLNCDLYFNEHTQIDKPIIPYNKGYLHINIKSKCWSNFDLYLKASCIEFTDQKFSFIAIKINEETWKLAYKLHLQKS